MTSRSKKIPEWQAWDGEGFQGRSYDATVYFALGQADIEDSEVCRSLAQKLREDGVTDDLQESFFRLESATVFHGQVQKSNGDWFPWRGVPEWDDLLDETLEATWVEIGDREH